MDNTTGTSGGSGSSAGPGAGDPREELRDQLQAMGRAAGDLLEQLVKMPVTLAQIPLQALPEDTATHARNAATEGFAALRSLVDTMAKGVDEVMRQQRERMSQAGSMQTGVGGDTTPPAASTGAAGDARGLDTGATAYLGGHGAGAGPLGGSSDDYGTAGTDNGTGNTAPLDEQP